MLNKTCRLCTNCELLVAHNDEIEPLIAASEHGSRGSRTELFVLGTAERRVWRGGRGGRITLGEVREQMASFKEYLRVDFPSGGWHRAGTVAV